MSRVDVLVVGAGPYGLSLAAHLRARGIEHRIVGDLMAGWRNHMPAQMLLKSQPWASSIAAPDRYSILQYCEEEEAALDPIADYVPLDTFIRYGEHFGDKYLRQIERSTVVSLSPSRTGQGLFVRLHDGEEITARRVVLAVGLPVFKYLPAIPMVNQLPSELVSHSSEYGPFDELRGKKVIVVGSGSSAIDLSVFLHEAGIDVSMVARALKLNWGQSPTPRSLSERLHLPDSGIGTGWPFMMAVYAPWAVHYLPDDLRLRFAYTGGLGPLGGFPMRSRLEGKVPVAFGSQVNAARINRGKIELRVTGDDGQVALQADHVVFATGYRIDVHRLRFLDPLMVSRMKLINGAPRLSRHYESSIPGLHFIGPAAAPSFGPQCRFVHGSTHPARHLARHFGLSPRVAGRRVIHEISHAA